MTRAVPQAALDLVKASEGYEPTRNADPAGFAQIGYGHKIGSTSSLWNVSLSEVASEELALNDLGAVAEQITAILGDPQVEELSEGQWAAILDFTFNEGIERFEGSTLCAMIKAGQLADAAGQFGRWVFAKVNGQEVKLDGLIKRRATEAALWNA